MSQSRVIKVRIPLTVSIDVDAWCDEYGTPESAAQIREDVKRHVESMIQTQLESLGVRA
jgi:hypothetical protein